MLYNPFSLEGKTILVTGASSGIGQATAIECSKMGAKLIITGRDKERLQVTLSNLKGEGHLAITCELTSDEDVEQLISKVPLLNGVVLCAGRGLSLPILFSSRKKIDPIFDINFFAPIELFRLLCKKKKFGEQASVVFIVSIGGTRRWTPGNGIYGASKAALNSYIHSAAIELGHKKIRVNGISPGMVETPLIHSGAISQEQMDNDRMKYPLERYGKPVDIAHSAIFLLSDASSWITGHSLVVDGGITAR